jgi:hypothetical protein
MYASLLKMAPCGLKRGRLAAFEEVRALHLELFTLPSG